MLVIMTLLNTILSNITYSLLNIKQPHVRLKNFLTNHVIIGKMKQGYEQRKSTKKRHYWGQILLKENIFPPHSSGLRRIFPNSLWWKYSPRWPCKICLPYRILKTLIHLGNWSFVSMLVTLNDWIKLCKASRAPLKEWKMESAYFSF